MYVVKRTLIQTNLAQTKPMYQRVRLGDASYDVTDNVSWFTKLLAYVERKTKTVRHHWVAQGTFRSSCCRAGSLRKTSAPISDFITAQHYHLMEK